MTQESKFLNTNSYTILPKSRFRNYANNFGYYYHLVRDQAGKTYPDILLQYSFNYLVLLKGLLDKNQAKQSSDKQKF